MLIWAFSTKNYVYGELYQNRASISNNAEQSDASITIDRLTMDDNGTYECSVLLTSDLGGVSKSRVYLLVLGECFLLPGVIGRSWGGWGVRRRHPGGKIKLETMPNEELRLLPSSSLSGGLGGLLLPWNQIRFCLGIQLPRTEVKADLEWSLEVIPEDSCPCSLQCSFLHTSSSLFHGKLTKEKKNGNPRSYWKDSNCLAVMLRAKS